MTENNIMLKRPTDQKGNDILTAHGLKGRYRTRAAAVALALYERALAGDVQAARFLLSDQQLEQLEPVKIIMDI